MPRLLRHQLPTHSPLSIRAILAGVTGALGRDVSAELAQRIRDHWRAHSLAFTASGTDALNLVLRAAFHEHSRVVALPAYGCYDLATAALAAQARVVLYDLDPDTLSPSPESLQHALEHKPAALVVVHQYGLPVDVPAIAQIAAASGALVIEDAAQGIGASLRGVPAGALGSIGILSFGRGKGLTGGGGGAVLSNDAAGDVVVERVRQQLSGATAGWRQVVRAGAQWLLARPGVYGIPAALPFLRLGETVFQAPHEPAAPTRSSFAMVSRVWQASLEAVEKRRRNAQRLLNAAARNPAWHAVRPIAGAHAGYLRLPLWTERPRDRLLSPGLRKLGAIQGYPVPLFRLPGFSEQCLGPERDFPGAELLARSLVTLPTHSLLTAADLVALETWLMDPSHTSAPEPQASAKQ